MLCLVQGPTLAIGNVESDFELWYMYKAQCINRVQQVNCCNLGVKLGPEKSHLLTAVLIF